MPTTAKELFNMCKFSSQTISSIITATISDIKLEKQRKELTIFTPS